MASATRVQAPPAGAVAAALLLLCGACRAAVAVAGPDTSGWRFESGGSTDGTNELYYESTVVDTVFLPRQRASDPEVRYAAVALAALQGTREQRALSYLLQGEVSYGDKIKRGELLAHWRQSWQDRWRLRLENRFEYRDDRSFDRDRQEWKETLTGRLRRQWGGEGPSLEIGNLLAVQRTAGDTTGFFLSNTLERVSMALEQVRFLEREWGLGYSLGYRVFPDSSDRDYFEHLTQARWKQYVGYATEAELQLGLTRRQTRDVVTTSRDNFWLGAGALEASARFAERWRALLRAEFEDTRYVLESATYFDYAIARGRAGARFESEALWSVELAPRVEWLRAPLQPAEDYLESAADVDLTWIGARSYVTLSPVGGWRDYQGSGDGVITIAHSSYAFYELSGYLDHRLPAGFRVRGSGSVRWERHTNSDDDSSSLYFSLDLRRIF